MSYAIIRNEKLTRAQAMGAYKHNERKTKNHSNKNIDSSKTELNYYLKKNELSYIKEFDRIKEKYDLKGQIRSNSNIMCEMVFTSDQKFFDKIDYQYQKIINKLEKENNYLKKVIDRFKITVQKFITWVCHKFAYSSENDLVRKFEEETYTNFNIEKQLDINKFEKKEKEDDLEYY